MNEEDEEREGGPPGTQGRYGLVQEGRTRVYIVRLVVKLKPEMLHLQGEERTGGIIWIY